jgi:hypothetical protein
MSGDSAQTKMQKQKQWAKEFRESIEALALKLKEGEELGLNTAFSISPGPGEFGKREFVSNATISIQPETL